MKTAICRQETDIAAIRQVKGRAPAKTRDAMREREFCALR
jgi:hypothetical protein